MRAHTLLSFLLLPNLAFCQMSADEWLGSWVGQAFSGQEQTGIRINIHDTAPDLVVDVDLLDIGVIGIPVQDIIITDDELFFTIPSDSGPQAVSLERKNNNELSGFWSESDKPDAELSLRRSELFIQANEINLTIAGAAGGLGVSIISPQNSVPVAGAVFVHGSGAESRSASRFAALRLAESGIASAIFDKRGAGESEGDWRNADFAALATDVLAVTEVLMEFTNLDINQIGFIATSQGGWVAPLAASSLENLGFIITISGPATTPREEGHWNVIRALQMGGYDDGIISEADEIMDLWDEGVLRDGDFSEYSQALEAASNEEWLIESGLESIHSISLPNWFVGWYQQIMNFDPRPIIENLNTPMLAIMGDQDEEQPWARSTEILAQMIDAGKDITVVIYPNANHAIRLTNPQGSPVRWPGRPDDFFSRQVDFILGSVNSNE
tara:strand:+ start:18284 stop:19606 length:1323 start_codon:yes stop_codon:yes gene_type:complete